MDKWKPQGTIIVTSLLIVAQYILAFFVFKLTDLKLLQWLGFGTWLLSTFFGIAPIFIFRQKGGVAKNTSYVKTTILVDTGLYAIVRHPQYLAGILFNLALMLLSPHWLVLTLGLISSLLIYLDIPIADQEGIHKFGQEYRDYMQRVPRANFLLGLALLLIRRFQK